MRILIATDAWLPQTNGVVSTLRQTVAHLSRSGHIVEMLTPQGFRTMSCPGYAEIQLALGVQEGVRQRFEEFRPEAVHIATEGPDWLCRAHALRGKALSVHDVLSHAVPAIPAASACRYRMRFSYSLLRWFHGAGAPLHGQHAVDAQRTGRAGLPQPGSLAAGVSIRCCSGRAPRRSCDLPRPIAAYVGRLAVEKNIDAFLAMDMGGQQAGNRRWSLNASASRRSYPEAVFVGYRHGEDLASHLAAG